MSLEKPPGLLPKPAVSSEWEKRLGAGNGQAHADPCTRLFSCALLLLMAKCRKLPFIHFLPPSLFRDLERDPSAESLPTP